MSDRETIAAARQALIDQRVTIQAYRNELAVYSSGRALIASIALDYLCAIIQLTIDRLASPEPTGKEEE